MDGKRLQTKESVHTPLKVVGFQRPYQIILYSRALHPELFQLRARRVLRHPDYEFEAWVMNGMHVLRFSRNGICSCELLTDQERSPASGVVCAFLCAGERDFEHAFEDQSVNYMTTVQTETLSENIYDSTYAELCQLSKEDHGLLVKWDDESGRCLSLVDIQEYSGEIHAQCYHMIAQGGLVVRTQTIFETA